MKVIFLDIDGVLNNDNTTSTTPNGFVGIGNSLLKNLYKIVQATDAKIVLTSTWKDDWDRNIDNCTETGIYMNKKFNQKQLYILDKVEDMPKGSYYRALSVIDYLHKYNCITDFVIIDDNHFDFDMYEELANHIVYTDEKIGLTLDDVKAAINILT